MSYTIYKSDGTLLVTIPEGTFANAAASISLWGKTTVNYGAPMASNLVHMLENFASNTQPSNPINGQFWYDTGTGTLRMRSSSTWSSVINFTGGAVSGVGGKAFAATSTANTIVLRDTLSAITASAFHGLSDDSTLLVGRVSTTAATANTVVIRDGSGAITATAFHGIADSALTLAGGGASMFAIANTIAQRNASADLVANAFRGVADSAVILQTGRTISITGDISYSSAAFNGSGNVTGVGTLATVNSNVGSFGSTTAVPIITVNGKGLITAVTTATLGTAAVANTGTSGHVLGFLDGANTFSLKQTFVTSNSTTASITLPHGTAPSAPVNGDIWTQTDGVWARVNGVNQHLADAAAAGVTSFNTRSGSVTLISGDISGAGGLLASNNLSDVTAATARTNLGLTAMAQPATASTIAQRDSSGNLTVNRLIGTADALTTGRTISITGDIAYTSTAFDGTTNVTAAGTLATVNSNTGSFGSTSAIPIITVNAKGLITAVSTAALGTAAVKNTGTSGNNVPLLDGGNTWSLKQIFPTSGTGTASINIPHGVAPTSPTNGDIWTETDGVWARVNGVNQHLADAASAGVSSWNTRSGAVTLNGTDISGAGGLLASNNLSDLISASTARTNLGVTATGADTTYATRSANLSDLVSISTARTNLGLGTAATQNTGTSGANLPFLNGTNTWANAQTFTVAPVFTDSSGSRTALGLGTAATQNTGTLGANLPFLNGTNTWASAQTFTTAPVFTDASGSRTALGLTTMATAATGSTIAERDGSGDLTANVFHGTATAAEYADLAERFEASEPLQEGDVVTLGGNNEIRKAKLTDDILGVISTKPAFGMNAEAGTDETHPFVAYVGRIPVNIIGSASKFDYLVMSNIDGVARAVNSPMGLDIIGRALENKISEEIGHVLAVVK